MNPGAMYLYGRQTDMRGGLIMNFSSSLLTQQM